MSAIVFQSPSGEARLRGSERQHAMASCVRATLNVMEFHKNYEIWRRHMKPAPTLSVSGEFLGYYFGPLSERFVTSHDKKIPTPSFALNTAIRASVTENNDAVNLLARLHGQCECFLYVEGKNRNWLADIIDKGLKSLTLSAEVGWEDVAKLLRTSEAEPVVCSYTGSEDFPNSEMSNWSPPEDDPENYDLWYELPVERRWNPAMEKLRKYSVDNWLELKPENFKTFYYRNGICAQDILEGKPPRE